MSKTVNQSFSESVQDRLEKFIDPEESSPDTLEQVLMNMLINLDVWLGILKSTDAPRVVIAKYEGVIKALKNEALPLKCRARDSERTSREILTSVEWYTKDSERDEFEIAKKEALEPCVKARRILGGQRVQR